MCLRHYLDQPSCKHKGCHRPQADARRGKRYVGLYLCWEHMKTDDGDEMDALWLKQIVERRSCWPD
jgi:hypothetical protein